MSPVGSEACDRKRPLGDIGCFRFQAVSQLSGLMPASRQQETLVFGLEADL